MCERRTQRTFIRKALRRHNSSGINNVGLMARALTLKDGATPDEQENVKWQTLQVSTMSVASCVGRMLIGICPSEMWLSLRCSNLLFMGRCNSRFCKAQGDETGSVHVDGGRLIFRFPVRWPSCSEYRTAAIRGHLGWDFVWCGVRTHTDHRHRMVRNWSVQFPL